MRAVERSARERRPSRGSRGYGLVLVLTAGLVTLTIALPDTWWARSLIVAAAGGTLFVAALVAEAHRSVVRAVIVAWVAGIAGVALAGVGFDETSGAASAIGAVLVALIPVVMWRGVTRALRTEGVTGRAVFGAMSFYLLIGISFTLIYGVVARWGAQPLFASGTDGTTSVRTYFSFITQATVGYGDYTPGSGIARSLAVLQALIGQLYLVTVLALLVGNLGRRPGELARGRDDSTASR